MADWTRRSFLRHSGTATGMVGLTAAGVTLGQVTPAAAAIRDAAVPTEETIYGWIRRVFRHGVRRPGYPADIWAERWIAHQFRRFGLEKVRFEPVAVKRWRPHRWSLTATTAAGTTRRLQCFPAPYAEPVHDLELELAAYDRTNPSAVAGKASLYDVAVLRVPADLGLTAVQPQRVVDPDGTMPRSVHVLPLAAEQLRVMEPSMTAGAAAFVGSLKDYPGTVDYYVPYDAVERPIPGMWVSGADGAWLRGELATGPVRIRLTTISTTSDFTSYNVVGELPGADDDVVMVGSHHDGPWSSAVEDGSGISLVLAQAKYWAARPPSERPHRMVFLLQGGHMSGGAGLHTYIDEHRAELDRVVLELHLEHAAREFVERDGDLVPSGLNVPRWFFTSEVPQLEAAVRTALVTENLKRSLILPPKILGGDQPPTDGGHYYSVGGVPIVNFMAAPFYLFDSIDTLDKIDRAGLVPLTRAAARILEATRGVHPEDWR